MTNKERTIHKKMLTIKNRDEMVLFAAKIAGELKGGEIIGLEGTLGAGKTTFTQGLAKSLGVKENITSPTFVLMKVYSVRRHQTIKFFVHVDLYRLEDATAVWNLGLADYLGDKNAVVIIEWAEKLRKELPKNKIWIKIKLGKGEERKMKVLV